MSIVIVMPRTVWRIFVAGAVDVAITTTSLSVPKDSDLAFAAIASLLRQERGERLAHVHVNADGIAVGDGRLVRIDALHSGLRE